MEYGILVIHVLVLTINQILPVVGYDEVLNGLSTLEKQVIVSLDC